MKISNLSYLFFLFIGLSSCLENNTFSDTPRIEFISLSKDSIIQSALNEDTLSVTIYFEDGDGDISFAESEVGTDITLIDNRTGKVQDQFRIPSIPPEGTGNGLSGTLTIEMFTTCCLPPGLIPCSSDPRYPLDSLSYTIFITDRAGNTSNKVATPQVILKCQ